MKSNQTDLTRVTTLMCACAALFFTTAMAACVDVTEADDDEDASGTGSSGNTGSTGSGSPAVNCEDRCSAKSQACGLSAAESAQICPDVCNSGLTESQLNCLEAASCADLSQYQSLQQAAAALCGSTGSGNMGGQGTLYDSCQCEEGGNVWASCVDQNNGCGSLTCIEVAGDPGFCSKECAGDADCSSGACTEFIVQGTSFGKWCAP